MLNNMTSPLPRHSYFSESDFKSWTVKLQPHCHWQSLHFLSSCPLKNYSCLQTDCHSFRKITLIVFRLFAARRLYFLALSSGLSCWCCVNWTQTWRWHTLVSCPSPRSSKRGRGWLSSAPSWRGHTWPEGTRPRKESRFLSLFSRSLSSASHDFTVHANVCV